jgi:hypothetical protein
LLAVQVTKNERSFYFAELRDLRMPRRAFFLGVRIYSVMGKTGLGHSVESRYDRRIDGNCRESTS